MLWAGAVREASGGEELELDKRKGEAITGRRKSRSKGREEDFSGTVRDTLQSPGNMGSGIKLHIPGNV